MSVQEAFERTLGSAPARADIIIVITANLPRGIPDRQVFDLETSFYCVRADEWLAVRGELERALGYAPESICAIKDLSNVTPDDCCIVSRRQLNTRCARGRAGRATPERLQDLQLTKGWSSAAKGAMDAARQQGVIHMSVLKEFREFALKGNVVDLAVGVIIGAAFTGIVQSLVNDLIMPPIGWITGGLDFSDLAITLPRSPLAPPDADLVTVNYGKFLTTLIGFLIVAWVIFLLVKMINRLKRKQEAAPPSEQPADVKLLTEIRDLLKQRQ
jgi:large conductance mechanosensitive channel